MIYEPKLKPVFYILCILLCALVVFGWYAIYFLNTNVIMMEDVPMSSDMRTIMTVLLSVIVGTWTFSLVTAVTQAVRGYAYSLDETGICNTLMGIMIFSLIIVIPIKCIPYTAIAEFTTKDGEPVAKVRRKEVVVPFILRPFVRGEYFFLYRLSRTDFDELKGHISRHRKEIC